MPCERAEDAELLDPPLLFPCGHIIGESCYEALHAKWKEGHGPCNQRIIYECGHIVPYFRIPHFYKRRHFDEDDDNDEVVPDKRNISEKCRVCQVQEYLNKWTIKARLKTGDSKIWVNCGDLHGISEEERAQYGVRQEVELEVLEDEEIKNDEVMRELFESTPKPYWKKGEKQVRLNKFVLYWTGKEEEKSEAKEEEEEGKLEVKEDEALETKG
ncbi:hypothetical protein ACHAPJ_002816 [Fusarium lateritium]